MKEPDKLIEIIKKVVNIVDIPVTVKDIRGNGYGDEYVTINVKIPTYLNSKQKEALENYKNAKNSDSLKDKFKRAFK